MKVLTLPSLLLTHGHVHDRHRGHKCIPLQNNLISWSMHKEQSPFHRHTWMAWHEVENLQHPENIKIYNLKSLQVKSMLHKVFTVMWKVHRWSRAISPLKRFIRIVSATSSALWPVAIASHLRSKAPRSRACLRKTPQNVQLFFLPTCLTMSSIVQP